MPAALMSTWRREIEPHGAGLIQVLIVDAIRDIACHV